MTVLLPSPCPRQNLVQPLFPSVAPKSNRDLVLRGAAPEAPSSVLAKVAVVVFPLFPGWPVPSSTGAGAVVGAGCRQQSLMLGWELGLSPGAGGGGQHQSGSDSHHRNKIRNFELLAVSVSTPAVCAQASFPVGSPWHPSMTQGAGLGRDGLRDGGASASRAVGPPWGSLLLLVPSWGWVTHLGAQGGPESTADCGTPGSHLALLEAG